MNPVGTATKQAHTMNNPNRQSELKMGSHITAAVEPPDTAPTTTEPTQPDATTAPAEEELVGAGDPDGDIDGTVALIAVIGFVVLLAIASWWMVRRSDPDSQPMPPRPPGGPPPSDLI